MFSDIAWTSPSLTVGAPCFSRTVVSALIQRFSLPESCDLYKETIKVTNFRCFKETMLMLRQPSESADANDDPKLHCRDVNLLLGDIDAGKTSILKAFASKTQP
jgi:hypothetical protein